MKSVQLTYPDWCKEMQVRLEKGELEPKYSKYPWFDWAKDRPTRALIQFTDAAPYHCGISLQLGDKSMAQIAELLRLKGIECIKVSVPAAAAAAAAADGTAGTDEIRVEVPAEGKKWSNTRFPSADQVKAGAHAALKALDPQLVEAPWGKLVKDVKDKWGPDGMDGWIVLYNKPYSAKYLAVEYK
jgi:hypothetical protein